MILARRPRWVSVSNVWFTHRPHSSSFWGLPSRLLSRNPRKELLWGPGVGLSFDFSLVCSASLVGACVLHHQFQKRLLLR